MWNLTKVKYLNRNGNELISILLILTLETEEMTYHKVLDVGKTE